MSGPLWMLKVLTFSKGLDSKVVKAIALPFPFQPQKDNATIRGPQKQNKNLIYNYLILLDSVFRMFM